MALQVRSYHLNVGLLIGCDLGAAYLVEDIAYALKIVADLFDHLGFAVLACFEFGREGSCLSLGGGTGCHASVDLAAQCVDLGVESVDFGLVFGIGADETWTEIVGDAKLAVECGQTTGVGG